MAFAGIWWKRGFAEVGMFCARWNDAEVRTKKRKIESRRAVKSEMDPSPLLAELSLKRERPTE